MDKHSYMMSECDAYCGLVSLRKSCAGDKVADLGLVGESNLDKGLGQRQRDRITVHLGS